MNRKNASLLPSGLYDLLPPDAHKESSTIARLLAGFESFGYVQVAPPLLEFETSLLSGRGESLSPQTFRVMDPSSQAMMGLRSDITMQIARIAHSRLAASPRPLRLCYAGPILQIKPEPLRNERQLTQAGIELIGADSLYADAEIMMVAAEVLTLLGIKDISIDINLPGLLGELCPEALKDTALRARIKDAVTRKDVAMIKTLPIANSAVLASLLEAAGPADKSLPLLQHLRIAQAGMLSDVIAHVQRNCPYVSLTIDPIEYRGFNYHEGISFSIFASGLRHELGRGGSYKVEKDSATGFTLYVTHLLPLLPEPADRERIMVPQTIDPAAARALRAEGRATLYALSEDAQGEAKKLGIKHIWKKETL